jgi:uncharacterized protein
MKTEFDTPSNMNIIFSGWLIRIIFFVAISIILIVPFTALSTIFALHNPNLFYDGGMLMAYFAVFLGFLISSIIVEKLRLGGLWHTFGITINKLVPKDFWTGFIFAFCSMLFILFIALLWGNQPATNFHKLTFENLVYSLLLVFVAASLEELMCRGIMFQALSQRFGFAIAAFISSILFAAGHLFNPSFSVLAMFNTFLAGIVLASMYHQTKSLWMPISFHFFWNLLQILILGSYVSGMEMGVPLFRMHLDTLPFWLFGGNYGIEGGLIATLILIVLIFMTAKTAYSHSDLSAFIFKRQILENEISISRKHKKLQ